jgi:mono/diheme cytochrome c family protein
MWRRILLRGLGVLVVLFLVIQLVPYGRSHTNPPTTREPAWDAPQTRALFLNACGDCHSNLTTWPFYTNVAPFSWLTQKDVDGGRATFNVSRWDRPQDVDAAEITESIRGGDMPPWFYTPLHPQASLSSAEQARLVAGLARTFAATPPIAGGGG